MTELLLLRLTHILAGTFWVGAALMNTVFLAPAAASLGPTGGTVMLALRDRGMMHWLLISAVLTLLSGVRLFWVIAGGEPVAFMASPMGRTFAVAGAAAMAAFALSLLVSRPAGAKMAMLAHAMGDTAPAERETLQQEMARWKRRSAISARVNSVLLVGSVVGMAVARYR